MANIATGRQVAEDPYQRLREVGVDIPVTSFVGMGQRVALDWVASAHVVQLATLSAKAGLNVA